MTLGELIVLLDKQIDNGAGDLLVRVDMPDGPSPVVGFSCYRGYYRDLALCTETAGDYMNAYNEEPLTVRGLRDAAVKANGGTFEGYKGGDYTMTRSTAVWVAPGNWASISLIPTTIEQCGSEVVISTAYIGDYA